jgi:subtilisin family serine protease
VLSCSGPGAVSGIIAAVDWVTSHRVDPAIANLSLVSGASSALDTAVGNSIASGVTYAVTAGSSNADACGFSPARVVSAITVGSTAGRDVRSSFSNFGRCVDIFAPGSNITSAWATNDAAINIISGGSMATAHVAGVAALYLATHAPVSPATVRNALVNSATTNVIGVVGSGSPNRLLYSLVP